MEISRAQSNYTERYSNVDKVEMKRTDKVTVNQEEEKNVARDEYISSEKSGNRPTGLYGLTKDENGNPKIVYDDPKKKEANSDEAKPVDGKDKSEKCTTNTDAVDSEIEKLKQEKNQIQQQMQNTNLDEEKKKELMRKLTQIESKIAQKDNDSYRRQNAVTSNME